VKTGEADEFQFLLLQVALSFVTTVYYNCKQFVFDRCKQHTC